MSDECRGCQYGVCPKHPTPLTKLRAIVDAMRDPELWPHITDSERRFVDLAPELLAVVEAAREVDDDHGDYCNLCGDPWDEHGWRCPMRALLSKLEALS